MTPATPKQAEKAIACMVANRINREQELMGTHKRLKRGSILLLYRTYTVPRKGARAH